jgi:hypothetical protein
MRSIEWYLRENVDDQRFWDGEYDTTHVGEYDIEPMTEQNKSKMFDIYNSLPHPFSLMK